MIQSMTGYGKASTEINHKRIQIEIKTLNSKNIDINLRMPQALRSQELEWRKQITSTLKRGKVDVYITLENENQQAPVQLNKAVINDYIRAMKSIAVFEEDANAKLLEIALSLPESTLSVEEDADESDLNIYSSCLQDALNDVVKFRTSEGENLEKDVRINLDSIQNNLDKVAEADGFRKENIKERLESALSEIDVDYDRNRFEQELIYYLEKFDISEEKTRLRSHIDYFKEVSESNQPNGKKLNFISQEMGREINTIGSKANDATIQSYVVGMKDDLEKIKEQLLNIL